MGAIDQDLADFFNVQRSTISAWKNDYPAFKEALVSAKSDANAKVKRSLYERACGYQHAEDKIFLYEGKPVVVETVKNYPPEPRACEYWLNNRDSENWSSKQTLDIPTGLTIKIDSKDAGNL